ncbi:MAG: CRISPR-associated endonuclease Cas2 [Acidobacteriota bacterium]
MSHTESRNWLIAYDISDPRRLVRVHRYLKRHAIPVQYSVFVLHGNQLRLEGVLDGLADIIAPDADDVRAYHLPDRCEVTMLGRQSLPEGVMVGASGLDRLLRELTVSETGIIVDPDEEEEDDFGS